MKKILLVLMIMTTLKGYSEITLKIHEPIRFDNVNTKAVGDMIVGQGTIEITTDNLDGKKDGNGNILVQGDRDKKFVFRFPKKGLMTNKKRMVEIDSFVIEDAEKTFRLTREKKLVKIYAMIERRKLNDSKINAEDLEGEYIGYVPVVVEQYGKEVEDEGIIPNEENKVTTLPIFPDTEGAN